MMGWLEDRWDWFWGLGVGEQAGVAGAVIGGIALLWGIFTHFSNRKTTDRERRNNEMRQNTKPDERLVDHDRKIIEQICSLLPYDRTRSTVENAPRSGMRIEVARDFEQCEKFGEVPYRLYNHHVEQSKQKLVEAIKRYNLKCMDFLGAQENPGGGMLLPPYHWKSGMAGQDSIDLYYSVLRDLADEGICMFHEYDNFISVVKQQQFPITQI